MDSAAERGPRASNTRSYARRSAARKRAPRGGAKRGLDGVADSVSRSRAAQGKGRRSG